MALYAKILHQTSINNTLIKFDKGKDKKGKTKEKKKISIPHAPDLQIL